MATYTIPKITPSVFNSSDYIESNYLTKTQADALYINEIPESVEKLIGNLQITGDETVQNQLVLGNSVISGTLRAGVFNSSTKDSYIYGNVTIGDQLSTNITRVYLPGENVIGLYKPTKINGQVEINTDTTWGINTTIGKSTTDLNIFSKTKITNVIEAGVASDGTKKNILKGNIELGDLNDSNTSTNIMGTLNVNTTKPINLNGSTINTNCPIISTSTISGGVALDQGKASTICGNVILGDTENGTQVSLNGQVAVGSNTGHVKLNGSTTSINVDSTSGDTFIGSDTNPTAKTKINGTFFVGNGVKEIAMSGSSLALQTNPGSGNAVFGQYSQLPGSGQKNTFLSSQNGIYNPRICDNAGVVTSQNFCLNSPSFCSFNAGCAYSSNTFTLPNLDTRVVYLNLPNLPNHGLYCVTIEYTQNVLMGTFSGTNGTAGCKIIPYSKTFGAVESSTSRSRYCFGQFILFINRDPASATVPYTFSYKLLQGDPVNPFTSVSFTYISRTSPSTSTTANFQPITISNITGASQSTNKIKMQMNLPNVAQVTNLGDFVICATGSLRVISSVSNQFSCAPSNTNDGLGGEAYWSLS